jgi:hypothetical protein
VGEVAGGCGSVCASGLRRNPVNFIDIAGLKLFSNVSPVVLHDRTSVSCTTCANERQNALVEILDSVVDDRGEWIPMTDPTEPEGTEFARGATTLLEVLNQARASGFGGSFDVTSAEAVGCLQCGRSSPARLFGVARVHRLEGASDAADELIVVEVTCPECGRGGTPTLGYGPAAWTIDDEVVTALTTGWPGGAP